MTNKLRAQGSDLVPRVNMKRHQVTISTGWHGKTWACCQTCKLQSKSGSRRAAEEWAVAHQLETAQAAQAAAVAARKARR